jgi:hypothetical protein
MTPKQAVFRLTRFSIVIARDSEAIQAEQPPQSPRLDRFARDDAGNDST